MASPLFHSFRSKLDFYSAGWNRSRSAIWSAGRSKRTNGSIIGTGRLYGTHPGIYYINGNDYSKTPGGLSIAGGVTFAINIDPDDRSTNVSGPGLGIPAAKACNPGKAGSRTTRVRVPPGVTAMSILLIGGGGGAAGSGNTAGGGGGGGGALRYYNNFPVVPGTFVEVSIGDGGEGGDYQTGGYDGGDSIFTYNSVQHLVARGGQGGCPAVLDGGTGQNGTDGLGGTGTTTGGPIGGGNGGAGGRASWNANGGAGGGAGGYLGKGGDGGEGNTTTVGQDGAGGGGGGGGSTSAGCGGGGGVFIYGQGDNGLGGGTDAFPGGGEGGGGGSWTSSVGDGLPDTETGNIGSGAVGIPAHGGWYGGGGGADEDDTLKNGGNGMPGSARIVWGPTGGFSFPSTNVGPSNNEFLAE